MPFSSANPLSFAIAWGVPTSGILLLGAFAILCLALVAGRGRRSPGFSAADYRAKSLLSAWEAKALAEIQSDLPRGYHLCPQVRLADAVEIVQRDPSLRRAALGRVAQKSVDFAVIDGQGRVSLVLELDDRSHDRADRRRRDEMVDAVLAHCGIPIKRIRPGQRVSVCTHLREPVRASLAIH
jgi:hypothetical protein